MYKYACIIATTSNTDPFVKYIKNKNQDAINYGKSESGYIYIYKYM